MKNFFSLNWFKSERQIELENLKVQEQALKNKLLEKEIGQVDEVVGHIPVKVVEKLYTSLKLVNNVLSVVLNDGSVVVKTNATSEHFYAVKNASSEEEVLAIMVDHVVEKDVPKDRTKAEQLAQAASSLDVLKSNKDFVVEDGSVYLASMYYANIKRSIPALLVNQFVKVINNEYRMYSLEDYEALKKFWLKCCLNPNAQSAEDLYEFLTFHQFKIDRHGNFYAYRRVVSKQETDTDLVNFISNTYNKVKAVWKKKPDNFRVVQNLGQYKIQSVDSGLNDGDVIIGNLTTLYLDLPNMASNSYTSAHTGMEDYRVGSVISMPRHEGDDNNNVSCSKGFHAASKEYDYSGFGDTPILVIINPMDVLSVPIGEVGKLRTCRWFFAMTLTEDEQHILDDEDFDVTDLGDVFEESCTQELEDYVHNSFVEEVKRHTFNIPTMSNTQIRHIVKTLDQMKDEIKKRVQTII